MLTPFNQGFLPEVAGHNVKYWEYGNKSGTPIVTLHGGPGSKTKPRHIECFDLTKYRVIAFDQKGCGESTFTNLLSNNTTQDLISDIERLREHLGIKTWFVAGSSWGSTLALAYAEAHPDKVNGLLMSSIFLARQEDAVWAFGGKGAREFFPDLWGKAKFDLSPTELLNQIEHAEIEARNELVAKVLNWEGNLMTSQTDLTITSPEEVVDEYLPMVKLSLHYLANNYFLADNELIANISAIKDIPAVIVHGRYDILCPTSGAYALHQSLNNSELVMLPNSNHKLTADGLVAQKLAYAKFLLSQGV